MATEDDWDDWIERCLTEGKGLTDWERNFCESLHDQRSQGRTLSARQVEILEKIYAAKTA